MATFPTSAKFIEPADLKDILSKDQGGVAVVDVRSFDYSDGKIPGSINLRSEEFGDDKTVDGYLADLKAKGKSKIVVHCTKSQQRGPSCAQRFIDRLSASPSPSDSPEVLVLKGGFKAWQDTFATTEPSLIDALLEEDKSKAEGGATK